MRPSGSHESRSPPLVIWREAASPSRRHKKVSLRSRRAMPTVASLGRAAMTCAPFGETAKRRSGASSSSRARSAPVATSTTTRPARLRFAKNASPGRTSSVVCSTRTRAGSGSAPGTAGRAYATRASPAHCGGIVAFPGNGLPTARISPVRALQTASCPPSGPSKKNARSEPSGEKTGKEPCRPSRYSAKGEPAKAPSRLCT